MSHPNLHQQDIANPGAIGQSRNYPDGKNEPSTGHIEQGNRRTGTFTDSSRKRYKPVIWSTTTLEIKNYFPT
jgi:hypothetical protein